MIHLLSHAEFDIKKEAVWAIANAIKGGTSEQVEYLVSRGCIPPLCKLLHCQDSDSVRANFHMPCVRVACTAVGLLAAGNKDRIQQVIDKNVFPPLIHLLLHDEFDIKQEAAWAIANAIKGGTPEQVEYLVSRGYIPPLCKLLHCQDSNVMRVACKTVCLLVRRLSSTEKIRAEFGLSLVREYYFEHHCVEMLIVLKRLMPLDLHFLHDLMLKYLVGIPNVFRA